MSMQNFNEQKIHAPHSQPFEKSRASIFSEKYLGFPFVFHHFWFKMTACNCRSNGNFQGVLFQNCMPGNVIVMASEKLLLVRILEGSS